MNALVTLRQISELTGFAPATISRVLNNDPSMSVPAATRSTILEAAGKLQYKSRQSGARGKCRAPDRIRRHIAIAEMLSLTEQLWDPYYLFLKNYAAQACIENDADVTYLISEGDTYRWPERPVDGVLAIGIFSEAQVNNLAAFCSNLVFLDSSPDEEKYDAVVPNLSLGIRQALDHLMQKGHRRIGFLGPRCKLDEKKRTAPEVRRQRYIEYMKERGLFQEDLLLDAEKVDFDVWDIVGRRLKAKEPFPTALVAYNEETALAAVGALRTAGLEVPGDVSIISFNDTPLSQLSEPSLTSICAHVDTMSERAVKLLLERIGEPSDVPCKIVLPTSVAERGSVAEIGETRQTQARAV